MLSSSFKEGEKAVFRTASMITPYIDVQLRTEIGALSRYELLIILYSCKRYL